LLIAFSGSSLFYSFLFSVVPFLPFLLLSSSAVRSLVEPQWTPEEKNRNGQRRGEGKERMCVCVRDDDENDQREQ
jgi:hypothetical protein